MGFLQVDLDVLARAASDMADSVDRLRDARKKLSHTSGLVIGPRVLADAADEFQRAWHSGLDRMAEATTVCVHGLDATYSAYRTADRALAEVLRRSDGERGRP
jgi:hypothetical protein